jgi:hypothetical protein
MYDSFQDQENKMNSSGDDEITLKDIILKIQYWFSILWPQRFRLIALSLTVGLMAALYTKFLTKAAYTASYELFFQEESVGLSGAMRLASNFGLGSLGVGSASSSATVKEYLTSRSNIANAMTTDLENGRLIDRYYAEEIEKDEEFAQEFTAKFGINQRFTDSILTEVSVALNKGIIGADFNEENGVLAFDVTSDDETFTYDLAELLVKSTEEQFKDWKREKGVDAVNAFQRKVDSLELALGATLRRLGEYQDQNNSLISAVYKMEQMRLTIDMESLKLAYGEYVKGLEMSKAELMSLEPPFKYFDDPTYPLHKDKGSVAKSMIFGSVITGFLLMLFFIGRVEAKNIMAD